MAAPNPVNTNFNGLNGAQVCNLLTDNFTNLANGTAIDDDAITPRSINPQVAFKAHLTEDAIVPSLGNYGSFSYNFITGTAYNYTIDFDIGGNLNANGNEFTVPVTGVYSMGVQCQLASPGPLTSNMHSGSSLFITRNTAVPVSPDEGPFGSIMSVGAGSRVLDNLQVPFDQYVEVQSYFGASSGLFLLQAGHVYKASIVHDDLQNSLWLIGRQVNPIFGAGLGLRGSEASRTHWWAKLEFII